MLRWIGTAGLGFLAGGLWMLALSQVTFWLMARSALPAELGRVAVPLQVSGALWAGLCGALAAILIEWLFGRRSGLAAPVLFAAVFLIFQRLHGFHVALTSVELLLSFAIAWAVGAWGIVVAARAAAMRLQGRK